MPNVPVGMHVLECTCPNNQVEPAWNRIRKQRMNTFEDVNADGQCWERGMGVCQAASEPLTTQRFFKGGEWASSYIAKGGTNISIPKANGELY